MNLPKNQIAIIGFVAVLSLSMIAFTTYFEIYYPTPSPPKEENSMSKLHIDRYVIENANSENSITREINSRLKNETITPGMISLCQLAGPLRSDILKTSTNSNISGSAIFTLYEEKIDDPWYDYYLVWMKAEGSSHLDTSGNTSRITELSSGIILERDTDRITDWSPYTDTSGPSVPHEETIKLGKCMSISEDYTLQQGRTGVGSLSTGADNSTANFTIRWQGNLNGTQAIVGGAEIQVPKNAGYNYTVVIGVNGTNDKVT
jgi:hypothetical protein